MGKNKVHRQYYVSAEQSRTTKILTLQRQNDIIAMLLEGRENKEMIPYLMNKYRIAYGSAKTYISEGRDIIKERVHYEINNLISLHMNRYEAIYAGLYEIGAYGNAVAALKAKEKLLGFHKEGFHMKVTQGEIQSIQQQSVSHEYDTSKLDKAKENRLNELLEKAKRKK